MKISEVMTLKEISEMYDIPVKTLMSRMKLKSFNLKEGEDYKILGRRQSTIFSPSGVAKITSRRMINLTEECCTKSM